MTTPTTTSASSSKSIKDVLCTQANALHDVDALLAVMADRLENDEHLADNREGAGDHIHHSYRVVRMARAKLEAVIDALGHAAVKA